MHNPLQMTHAYTIRIKPRASRHRVKCAMKNNHLMKSLYDCDKATSSCYLIQKVTSNHDWSLQINNEVELTHTQQYDLNENLLTTENQIMLDQHPSKHASTETLKA